MERAKIEDNDGLRVAVMRGLSAALGAIAMVVGLAACGGSTRYVVASDGAGENSVVLGWHAIDPPVAVEIDSSEPIGSAQRPSLAGVVLVNIWASYCRPCVNEMKLLEEAHASDVVRIIGLSRDRSKDYALEALRKRAVTYPNWMDTVGRFPTLLDGDIPLIAIPSSVLVKDGRAVAAHIGEVTSVEEIKAGVMEYSR